MEFVWPQATGADEAALIDEEDRNLVIALGRPAQSHWRWRLRPEFEGDARPVTKGQVIADKVHDESREEQPGMTMIGQRTAD